LSDELRLPCGQVLRNRLAKAAMSEQLAGNASEPTPELVNLYGLWSASGAGLLITGNVMVDRRAISEPGQVVVEDGRHLDGLARWAGAARQGGARVWMQINHAGRQVPFLLARQAVAPSAVRLPGRLFARPQALDRKEIDALVRRYAATARVAVQAGFDGVQIHAAHGYLISQFLSPEANRRDDGYGGDLERRQRFLVDVIAAVREAVGSRAAVAVKLNASDFSRSGLGFDEALQHVAALDRAPIDLLEVSGGNFHSAAMLGVRGPSAPEFHGTREGYFLEFAKRARPLFRKPLMVTGGFRTAAAMQAALAGGAVDLVGLARPMVLDPHCPRKLLERAQAGVDGRVGASGPRTPGASGLFGGLGEIAWYTVQLWRLGQGSAPDPRLGPRRARWNYLVRQAAQQFGRRNP
jgi:2,4-dienoyl-CoA reductase-like NADH-dependent reductase (Old Yellow Enzyme family)